MDKINTLSLPEKLIAGGGVLMLIASIFPWWHYSISVLGTGASANSDGWSAPGSIWSVLAIILSLAMAGLVAATRLGNMQMPSAPQGYSWGQIWGAGGALLVVLMLLKAWRILAVPVGGFGIGFFIAVVATGAIAYGAYMLYSTDKGSFAR